MHEADIQALCKETALLRQDILELQKAIQEAAKILKALRFRPSDSDLIQ
jgi:hypothetical protein